MDKVTFLQDDNGNSSLMRVVFLLSAIVGAVLCLGGVVAMFMQVPAATVAMTAGAGLFTGAGITKALQKWVEK